MIVLSAGAQLKDKVELSGSMSPTLQNIWQIFIPHGN
jgi:hypothetical protein